jgi:hypothetical protein
VLSPAILAHMLERVDYHTSAVDHDSGLRVERNAEPLSLTYSSFNDSVSIHMSEWSAEERSFTLGAY